MAHPLEQLEITCELKFTRELAKQLVEYAERLKMKLEEMLIDLIHVAIRDDLVEAILDRDQT